MGEIGAHHLPTRVADHFGKGVGVQHSERLFHQKVARPWGGGLEILCVPCCAIGILVGAPAIARVLTGIARVLCIDEPDCLRFADFYPSRKGEFEVD